MELYNRVCEVVPTAADILAIKPTTTAPLNAAVAKEISQSCGAIQARASYGISALQNTLISKVQKDMDALRKIAPNS